MQEISGRKVPIKDVFYVGFLRFVISHSGYCGPSKSMLTKKGKAVTNKKIGRGNSPRDIGHYKSVHMRQLAE